jgi:effector-binding domain-containing protein
MQIKEIKPITALCFTCQTTLAGLGQYVRVKARELYETALENKLEVTGPVYWIYNGMDGKPQTEFTLEICLPVFHTGTYTGTFKIKELQAFRCASVIHSGAWTDMYKTYEEMIGNILNNGDKLTGTSREVYINMDFINTDHNITEIQVGVE